MRENRPLDCEQTGLAAGCCQVAEIVCSYWGDESCLHTGYEPVVPTKGGMGYR